VSLNSLQRRYRWLALPFDVGEILLTPERWVGGFDRATTRAAHRLAFDTTALGRFLQRVDVLSPMRDRLLGRSAALRWLEIIVPVDAVSALTEFDQQAAFRQIAFLYRGTLTRSDGIAVGTGARKDE